MKTRSFALFVVVLIQVCGQLHYAAKECDSDDFFQLDGANFSLGNLGTVGSGEEDAGADGVLILIPAMSFTCYGSVAAWSGLISVEVTDSADDTTHYLLTIHFQVWRPASGDGTFDLIGSQTLVFDSVAIGESSVLMTDPWEGGENKHTYYHQFTAMEDKYGSSLPVQPGDVVGCFIPTANHTAVASIGLAFSNESMGGGGEGERMDLMVRPIEGDICEAFACGNGGSRLKTLSGWPLLQPQYTTFTDDFGSASGSGYFSACSNLTGELSCSPKEDGWAVPGLLAVIAAACIAAACLVGVAANTVTFCIARRKFKQQSYSPSNLHKQLQRGSNTDRLAISCPFVVNHLAAAELEEDNQQEIEEPRMEHSLLNLEEYFDYTIKHSDNDTDSYRMSWV